MNEDQREAVDAVYAETGDIVLYAKALVTLGVEKHDLEDVVDSLCCALVAERKESYRLLRLLVPVAILRGIDVVAKDIRLTEEDLKLTNEVQVEVFRQARAAYIRECEQIASEIK